MLNVGALQRTFVMGGVNGEPLIGYNKPAKKMAWWWYRFGLSLPSDLREKTYVITGTTTGTGRCAAMALAERSARVICLNRPSERAVESLEAIKEAGAEFNAKVEHIDCDPSSFDSVKSAIAKLKKACGDEGIDVLCCNAGIMAIHDEATKDGYDVQMQVNHLSHFLLQGAHRCSSWRKQRRRGTARGSSRQLIRQVQPRQHVR